MCAPMQRAFTNADGMCFCDLVSTPKRENPFFTCPSFPGRSRPPASENARWVCVLFCPWRFLQNFPVLQVKNLNKTSLSPWTTIPHVSLRFLNLQRELMTIVDILARRLKQGSASFSLMLCKCRKFCKTFLSLCSRVHTHTHKIWCRKCFSLVLLFFPTVREMMSLPWGLLCSDFSHFSLERSKWPLQSVL